MRATIRLLPAISIVLLLASCSNADDENEAISEAASAPATEAQPANEPATSGEAPEGEPATNEKPATADQPAESAPAKIAAAQPPAAYAVCKTCHSVEPGKHSIGPSMHGIYGRKAASMDGFKYSPALTSSGLTWDRASLDTWLEAPMKMVPGTRMVIGVRDAAKRKEIIDYLATLK